VQGKNLKPYRYYKSVLVLLFIFQGILAASGQDSSRVKVKDTIFPRVDSLKAAIVTANLRPRLKGDTTEYNTSNIRMRAYATVEELIGRLPGLQIDPDGTITYNGQKITQLLVDGEDLFGGNPTLVTRNLDASKIAKVQILDRRSDRALFTGVDDGTRTKTLNLVMKESAKDGYFGKMEAGGNTDGYYNSDAVLAAFKRKEQFTALGLAANTGTVGFTNNSSGTSSSIQLTGRITDALGASTSGGIPQFAGVALHYANTWNGPDDHIMGNYQYSHFYINPQSTIQTMQVEPGYTLLQNQQSASINQQDQHWAYGTYDWAPSTHGAFRLTFRGSSAVGQNEFSSTDSSSFGNSLVNSSQRAIRDNVIQKNITGEVSWRTQVGRPNRNLSIGININKVNNTTSGYLLSHNQFFSASGNIQIKDTVDQRKQISDQPLTLGVNLNYIEPLWSGAGLALSYGLTTVGDAPLQATYTRGDGKYQELVDSLSSHFQTQITFQNASLNLQGKTGQLSYTAGGNWLGYTYRQKDILADSVLRQHFINLAPKIVINYMPNAFTNYRILYTGYEQQPSITQLQPSKNNNDPLHLMLGNPNLRPSLNQNINLDFRRSRAWLLNANLDLRFSSNSISTKTVTDSLGRQVSQPVNVEGNHAAELALSASHKILGFNAAIHIRASYSQAANYINADLSHNNSYYTMGGFSLNKNEPDKYNFNINTNFAYYYQVSSVNTTAPMGYWTQNHSAMLTLFLLRNYEITTNVVYYWQQKTSTFSTSTTFLLWNWSITRNFLQNKLALKAQLNNLLDQNAGIARSNVNNITTETRFNVLGRHWMLMAIYHFDKQFKKK
jgi:hypothetical protein